MDDEDLAREVRAQEPAGLRGVGEGDRVPEGRLLGAASPCSREGVAKQEGRSLGLAEGIFDPELALLATAEPFAGLRVEADAAALDLERDDAVIGVRKDEVGLATPRLARSLPRTSQATLWKATISSDVVSRTRSKRRRSASLAVSGPVVRSGSFAPRPPVDNTVATVLATLDT